MRGSTIENGNMNSDTLIQIKNLRKFYPVRSGLFRRASQWVRAVDGVSLSIPKGKAVGLVGESGCGKTTLGRLLLLLEQTDAGEIWYQGRDLCGLSQKQMRPLRKDLQIVFQDPYGSLNPRFRVLDIVAEGLDVFGLVASRQQRREKTARLLEQVGLSAGDLMRYPHEFSGGQRQRIGIARALAVDPKFILCDEPVSSLDVSIQAQILNLLKDLQESLGLSYLFIAHDLAVVEHVSDFVAVMYLGKIVEWAGKENLYREPQHPYTEALLLAVPVADPHGPPRRVFLKGDVPSVTEAMRGCHFAPRCPLAQAVCRTDEPALEEKRPGHLAACHFSAGW